MTRNQFNRTIGVPALFAILVLTFSGCGSKPPEKKETAPAPVSEARYECPMHPEVNQSTPGKCPKCGMELLEVTPPAKKPESPDHGESHQQDGDGSPGMAAHADHQAKHGGLFGMQGDHHLELVARHGGMLTVYAYDAHTKPMDMTKASGTVTLELPGAGGSSSMTVPLRFDAPSGALAGSSPEADRALSATVDLRVSEADLSMTFPLQSTLTGEVVDISCLTRSGVDGARGVIHAECAKACIHQGLPVGLAVGNSIYVLTLEGEGTDRSANQRLEDLAGRQVVVTGRVAEVNGLKVLELSDVREKS